jgi:pilus assembly protein Flp/PilA
MTLLPSLTAEILSLRNDRRGVTALEYGLIASLVAVAIVVSVGLLGTNLAGEFNFIAGKL